jgi:hypothetical protein
VHCKVSGSLTPRAGVREQGAEGNISVEERVSDGDRENFIMKRCAICALGILFRSSNEGDNTSGQW